MGESAYAQSMNATKPAKLFGLRRNSRTTNAGASTEIL